MVQLHWMPWFVPRMFLKWQKDVWFTIDNNLLSPWLHTQEFLTQKKLDSKILSDVIPYDHLQIGENFTISLHLCALRNRYVTFFVVIIFWTIYEFNFVETDICVFTSVCVSVSGPAVIGDRGVFCLTSFRVNCVAVAGILIISLLWGAPRPITKSSIESCW